MTVEQNTETGEQHANPDAGDDVATNAAKSDDEQGTDPGKSEGQGEGGKTGEDAGKGEGEDGKKAGDGQDDDPDSGPPEAYEDFKLPEGFTLEGERKDETLALFRELGLSQERAQKAIDHFIKTVGEDEAARAAAFEAAVSKQREDWATQAKTELGDKYDSELEFAKTAVNAVNSPKLLEAFNEMGWGNHPELIKAFALFGKMMRDSGSEVGGSGAVDPPKKPWEKMYEGAEM